MSESVKILIEADNKASAAFQKVGNDAELMSRRVKETGQKVKASFEISGTLSKLLGGTALGAFSSELAQITERVSAFSEVSKAGTLGAIAFKTGLVAAAGVATYKLTEGIASWWFEIDKATASAEKAEKAFSAMAGELDKLRTKRAAMAQEDFGLIRDPGERESAINRRAAEIETQLDSMRRKEADLLQIVQQRTAAYEESFKVPGVANEAQTDLQVAQDQLDAQRKNIAAIQVEAEALREQTSERAKSIQRRREENALADKSQAFVQGLRDELEILRATEEERRAITAQRNAPTQSGIARQLLEERDAILAKQELQKKADQEAELARKKEEDAIKRISELEQKRRVELEARRIELERGKVAAAAFRLEQDGLTKETARRLAIEEARVREQEQLAARRPDNSPIQATQGRLLTLGRGGSVDPTQKVVDAVERLIKKQDEVKAAFKDGFDKAYQEAKAKTIYLKPVVVP